MTQKRVNTQTEEQKLKVVNAVTERFKERDSLILSHDECRVVLNEFLDRVDEMFFQAAFGAWSEGLETPEFIDRLHPWFKPYDERIHAFFERFDVVPGDPARPLVDQFGAIKFTSQETGFKLGVLVGARIAGYPPEKVRKIAEYLVDTLP